MILTGLGLSTRQRSVVPHDVAKKPVEHLLGRWITAERLTDDGVGRTLEWLDAHDPTTLVAGRARQICGVSIAHAPVETTSCSVSGDDAATQGQAAGEEGAATEAEVAPALIAITSGSSRDHCGDLTLWILAQATTHDGEIPLVVQPLSGTSSDTMRVLAAMQALQEPVRATEEAPGVFVVDTGVDSDAKRRLGNQATITWISRVSETSPQAKHAHAHAARSETWHTYEGGSMRVDCRIMR